MCMEHDCVLLCAENTSRETRRESWPRTSDARRRWTSCRKTPRTASTSSFTESRAWRVQVRSLRLKRTLRSYSWQVKLWLVDAQIVGASWWNIFIVINFFVLQVWLLFTVIVTLWLLRVDRNSRRSSSVSCCIASSGVRSQPHPTKTTVCSKRLLPAIRHV